MTHKRISLTVRAMRRVAPTWIACTISLMIVLASLLTYVPYAQTTPISCEYWVAPPPAGNNVYPGTFDQPWATLDYASARVLALGCDSCTVWFKDGIYIGQQDLNERFLTPTTFKAIHPYKAIMQSGGLVLNLSGTKNMIFDGFEFRHPGPGVGELVVYVSHKGAFWSEYVTFRNNIFHDSYNNDLLKIYDGARFITFEGNVFYNQGAFEQHMDINSVTDITIQDNIFFNDYPGSGRSNINQTKSFIVIKDSNDNTDGLEGSERITIRRNIFLNWEGGRESFIQAGIDGKPFYEAKDVRVENNLMIGNALNDMSAAFGVAGAKNVTFINNTVVGDLPSYAYACNVSIKDLNPINQDIFFYNNIWSDPTGTMGANLYGVTNEFSDGNPAQTNNLILDNNLYWNGGAVIPPGDLVSPLIDDARRVVADPFLQTDQSNIIFPRWTGSAFLSGNLTIRQEFVRLVGLYGQTPPGSPAIGKADLTLAPAEDILGRPRDATPDMGAFEYILPPGTNQSYLPLIAR